MKFYVLERGSRFDSRAIAGKRDNRDVVAYLDGQDVPEIVRRRGKRITEQEFRELFYYLHGVEADGYIRALKRRG